MYQRAIKRRIDCSDRRSERGSIALPTDLPEKARRFVAAEEAKDREAQEDKAALSEAAAFVEADGGDASGLRYFAIKT